MRKKLLIAENANLFAELERKNTDSEALKIRLKEQTEAVEKLSAEVDCLTTENEELKAALCSAKEEIEELKAVQPEIKYITLPPSEAEQDNIPANPTVEEENSEKSLTDCHIKEVITEISAYNSQKNEEIPKTPPITAEQRETLQGIGAAEIGRVTKAVAQVTSAIQLSPNENTERLYSLALGKNEAFKIKVLSLTTADGDFDLLLRELKQSADSTIAEIKVLLEMK